MSSTTHRPKQFSSLQRQATASRSRSRSGSEAVDVFKGENMGFREQVVGYIGLAGFSGATHVAGVDFFSLTEEGRALWLAGAALVLCAVTCRGWHSPR